MAICVFEDAICQKLTSLLPLTVRAALNPICAAIAVIKLTSVGPRDCVCSVPSYYHWKAVENWELQVWTAYCMAK